MVAKVLSTLALVALILVGLSWPSYSQEELGEVGKPKPKPKTVITVKPKTVTPRNPTSAILYILTDPPTARVIIKEASGKVAKEGQSEEGQFQAELRPGKYIVEVSSDNYEPLKKTLLIKPSGTEPVMAQLVPTTGSIEIGLGSMEADPNVVITLDGQKVTNFKINKEENRIDIDNIPIGAHTLHIAAPSIIDYERKAIQVKGGSVTPVTPRFVTAVARLTVKTEPGANVYMDGAPQGKTPATGQLTFSEKPGRHTIRVEKDGFQPSEQARNFGPGESTLEVKLTRVTFSEEFSEHFTGAESWILPSGWQINRGKMTAKGSGTALLKDKVWNNFKMVFDLSLTNGKGAVWIVRARDQQNYYLFELSGPKGEHPGTFRTSICENGQLKYLKSDPVLEDLGGPKETIHIELEAKGSKISHSIGVSSNPKAGVQPLSVMEGATAYCCGTVGFRTMNEENFVVYYVTILPQ